MGCVVKSPITYDGRKQQAQQHAGQTGPYAPRTHHLHLPEDILRTVLPVQFGNLFDGTERNPQVRRVMQETDDAQVQGRKPHSGRAEQNSRQLVAHPADQYRKHLYASQKARVFYDVVVGRVFPAFRLFQDRQTVFYFLCLTHNMGDKDTAFPFIFCIFV